MRKIYVKMEKYGNNYYIKSLDRNGNKLDVSAPMTKEEAEKHFKSCLNLYFVSDWSKRRRTRAELITDLLELAAPLNVFMLNYINGYEIQTYYGTFYADTYRGIESMIKKALKEHIGA